MSITRLFRIKEAHYWQNAIPTSSLWSLSQQHDSLLSFAKTTATCQHSVCNVGIHLIHSRSTQKKQGEGTIYTSCAHFGSVFFFAAKSSKQKKDTTKMCLNGNRNIKIKTRKKWRKESEMVSQKSGQIISLGLKAVKVEYSAHQTWFLHFYFTLGYSESWFIC